MTNCSFLLSSSNHWWRKSRLLFPSGSACYCTVLLVCSSILEITTSLGESRRWGSGRKEVRGGAKGEERSGRFTRLLWTSLVAFQRLSPSFSTVPTFHQNQTKMKEEDSDLELQREDASLLPSSSSSSSSALLPKPSSSPRRHLFSTLFYSFFFSFSLILLWTISSGLYFNNRVSRLGYQTVKEEDAHWPTNIGFEGPTPSTSLPLSLLVSFLLS